MGIKRAHNALSNPGTRNFGGFNFSVNFLKLAFTSIERNFAGYTTKHNCLLVAPSLFRILLFVIIRLIRCFRKQFLVLTSSLLGFLIFIFGRSKPPMCYSYYVTGLFQQILILPK